MINMRKKLIILAAFAALTLTSCGNEVPPTSSVKTEPTTVAATTESTTEATTKEEEIKIIGTKKEGKDVYKVQFTNSTGKDITGFTIKMDQDEEYPSNMMAKGDVFGKNEKRELYDDTAGDPDTYSNRDDPNAPLLTTGYTIKVDFSDNTAALLHQFPFGDAKSAALKFDDDVLYIVYKSDATGAEVVTKEAEIMIKDNPDTAYDTDTTPNNNDSTSDNNTNNNATPDNNNNNNSQSYTPQPDNSSQGGGQTIQQTPVTPAPTDPPVVTPAPTEAPANGGDSGCLGGQGLFNDGDSSGGNSDSGCLGDGALFN